MQNIDARPWNPKPQQHNSALSSGGRRRCQGSAKRAACPAALRVGWKETRDELLVRPRVEDAEHRRRVVKVGTLVRACTAGDESKRCDRTQSPHFSTWTRQLKKTGPPPISVKRSDVNTFTFLLSDARLFQRVEGARTTPSRTVPLTSALSTRLPRSLKARTRSPLRTPRASASMECICSTEVCASTASR